MIYNIHNLNYVVANVIKRELGKDVFTSIKPRDDFCVDVCLDASLIILKVNDGFITIDKGGKLFTISPEDYQNLIV